MADLLKLVDQLIGSILQGNLYTDTNRFVDSALQRPDNADAHVPNTDPRLLNTAKGTTHPHADSSVIPPPPHSPPPLNREGVYKPGPPPADIIDQSGRMTDNTLPEAPGGVYGPPREVVPQTQANTGAELVAKNIPVGHTPQSMADRDKIYKDSNHRNRAGNPIDDLLSFHDSVEKSSDFAKARSFQNRENFYSSTRHDGGSEAQIKSNIGGGPPGPEGQPTSRPTLGDQTLPPPSVENQKTIDPNFAKGKQFDSIRRDDIYKNYVGVDENGDPLKTPSEVHAGITQGSQVGADGIPTSKPTQGDIASSFGKPPAKDLLLKGPTDTSDKPRDFKQPEGLDSVSNEYRKEIYLDKDPSGVPQTPDGKPPAPNLLLPGPDDIYEGFRPRTLQQPIPRDDIYKNERGSDDKNPSAVHSPQVDIGGPDLRPISLPGKPPADPLDGDPLGQVQHLSPKEISDLQSSKQFDSERRADIYQNYQSSYAVNKISSPVHASIGTGESVGGVLNEEGVLIETVPTSRPTLGDKKSAINQPPTSDLLIKGPTDTSEKPREFKQPEGLDRVSDEYRKEIYLNKDSNGTPLIPDGKPKSDPLSADPVNLPEVVYPLTTEPPFGDAPRSRVVPEVPRADFYQNYRGSEDKNPSAVHANIGHFEYADGDDVSGKYLNADDIGQPKDFAPTQGKIRAKENFAHRLGNIFHDNSTFGSFPGEAGSLRFFDIVAGVQWLDTVGQEVLFLSSKQNDPFTGEGKVETTTETFAKSTTWLASQFLLTAMNPTDTAGYGELNAIWNPLSLPLSAIPLLRSTPVANITVGAALGGITGGPYSQNVLNADKLGTERLVQIREGAYKKSVDGTMVAQLQTPDQGFKGDLASAAPGGTPTIEGKGLLGEALDLLGGVAGLGPFTIDQQVEGDSKAVGTVHTNLYTPDRKYDVENAIFPLYEMEEKIIKDVIITPQEAQEVHLSNRFITKRFPGSEGSFFPGSRPGLGALTFYSIKDGSTPTDGFGEDYQLPGADGKAAVVDVDFPGEDENGLLEEIIDEGQIYIPLMFQDLRDDSPTFLYFRAFLKPGIAETFTPDWQISRYYGRVDQIPVYQGTIRTLNFSFDVVAWGPKDLLTMWKKLQKLQSMVYPTYTVGAFMKAGPIIRLRIGDLIAGKENKGLPGYMTSMDWAYDDGIWNIKVDEKVPRKISISIGFTVLHEGNPGIYPYLEHNIDASDVDKVPSDKTNTFGAATFTSNDAGKTTDVVVSPEEIRRIFTSIRTSRGE